MKLNLFTLTFFFSLINMPISALADDFYYGVGVLPDRTSLSSGDLLGLMKKYKVSSFRVDYAWSRVETQKNIYEITDKRLDNLIKNSSKLHIEPLLILDYGNKNYGGGRPVSAEAVNAYANYSSWVVRKYKGNVHLYEIWNEWWHARPGDNYPALSESSAKDYYNLVRVTAKKIKDNDPQAVIVVGSFNPFKKDQLSWAESLIKLGVLDYVDGLSIHPYSQDAPEIDFSKLDDFHNAMITLSGKKVVELYITEVGYSDYRGSKLNDVQIENYIPRYFKLAKERPYIKGVWWYSLIDAGNDKYNREHNFGLLDKNLKLKSSMSGFVGTVR